MDYEQQFLILFFSMFAINIMELILVRKWVRSYYLFGIPLFKKEFIYQSIVNQPDLINKMNMHGMANAQTQLTFHTLGDNSIAFKEKFKLFQFGKRKKQYTPLMRGVIHFNQIERKVTIKGIANWSALLFIPFFYYFILSMQFDNFQEAKFVKFFFLVGPVLMLLFVYYKQTKLYNEIIESLKKEIGISDYTV